MDHKCIVGKDQWLFLDNDSNRVMEQISGKLLLSEEQLFKWNLLLFSRSSYLKSQGIKYFILIAPNKECVYPEFLPDNIELLEHRPINLLINYIKEKSDFENLLFYPLADIVKGKKRRLTYQKGDTHWNSYGAYIAYLHLVRKIKPYLDIDILEESSVKFSERFHIGDLANKIIEKPKSIDYISEFNSNSQCVFDNQVQNGGNLTIWENSNKKLPRAILFGDSFGTRLKPFLAESFSRLVTVHQPNLDYELILKEKPDVVISEYVERFMIKRPDDMNGPSNRKLVINKILPEYSCQYNSDKSDYIYDWNIGDPQPGILKNNYLRGWVIGKELPVDLIELVNLENGEVVKTISIEKRSEIDSRYPDLKYAEISDFNTELSEVLVEMEKGKSVCKFKLQAVFSDGKKAPLTIFNFERIEKNDISKSKNRLYSIA